MLGNREITIGRSKLELYTTIQQKGAILEQGSALYLVEEDLEKRILLYNQEETTEREIGDW